MENTKIKRKKTPILILSAFLLCTLCVIFSVLVIYKTKIAWIQENALLFTALTSVLFCTVALLCTLLVLRDKIQLVKVIFTVFGFVLFCLVVCYVLQITNFFEVVTSQENLQNYLQKAGAWMPIAYIILQFLQVIILPIPGILSTAVGVALFGAFYTTVYSFVGIVLGSILAFFIGRKFGLKAVSWMVGEETLNKWQKKLKGKDNFILTLAFLLPLFPDDILCFLAGLSSMTNKYFLTMICVSRFLAIATTCYSFNFIPFNTWWGLLIWGIIVAVIIVAFCLIYKNLHSIHQWATKRVFKKKKATNKNKNKR